MEELLDLDNGFSREAVRGAFVLKPATRLEELFLAGACAGDGEWDVAYEV